MSRVPVRFEDYPRSRGAISAEQPVQCERCGRGDVECWRPLDSHSFCAECLRYDHGYDESQENVARGSSAARSPRPSTRGYP